MLCGCSGCSTDLGDVCTTRSTELGCASTDLGVLVQSSGCWYLSRVCVYQAEACISYRVSLQSPCYGISLCPCYAMSGTDTAHGAIPLCPCYAIAGTDIGLHALVLRARCAMSSADVAYGAIGRLVERAMRVCPPPPPSYALDRQCPVLR